jgi:hypothetical protein
MNPSHTQIYIADEKGKQIIIFDQNGKVGNPISLANLGFGTMSPNGLAVDNNGNIYATDYENKRIVKMNSSGQLICEIKGVRWATTPSFPSAAVLFQPMDVAVDPSGDYLFVADFGNSRVLEFKKTLEGSPTTTINAVGGSTTTTINPSITTTSTTTTTKPGQGHGNPHGNPAPGRTNTTNLTSTTKHGRATAPGQNKPTTTISSSTTTTTKKIPPGQQKKAQDNKPQQKLLPRMRY